MYKVIITIYRSIFSTIPIALRTLRSRTFFTRRQAVTLTGLPFSIVVDPANGTTDAGLFFERKRDDDVIHIMKLVCVPGSTFVDIGANIGYETLWGSHLVGESGHVYSFEPLPNLAAQIRESLAYNHITNVTVFQKAAGDARAKASIYVQNTDAGLTSLVAQPHAEKSTDVEIETVDSLLGAHTIHMIKLDVEGYELEALRGAQHLIKHSMPVIVFEFSPHLYERDYAGKSLELLETLSSYGYTIYPIETLTKPLQPEAFNTRIQQILLDETIPNFVATTKPLKEAA